MKHLMMAACAALAIGVAGADEAVAQCGYGGGFGGYGYSGYSVPRSSFSVGFGQNNFRSYRSRYNGGFNRGHYDYHHRGHVHHLWR